MVTFVLVNVLFTFLVSHWHLSSLSSSSLSFFYFFLSLFSPPRSFLTMTRALDVGEKEWEREREHLDFSEWFPLTLWTIVALCLMALVRGKYEGREEKEKLLLRTWQVIELPSFEFKFFSILTIYWVFFVPSRFNLHQQSFHNLILRRKQRHLCP